MQPLLHSKTVEDLLNLAAGSLAVMRCRQQGVGLIPYIRIGKRGIRYDPNVIKQWLSDNTIDPA